MMHSSAATFPIDYKLTKRTTVLTLFPIVIRICRVVFHSI
jgi:hypothetical protein